MKKYIEILSFIKYMGIRPILFRFFYELKKLSKYFYLLDKKVLDKKKFKKLSKYSSNLDLCSKKFVVESNSVNKADKAIDFEIFIFSNQFLNYAPKGKMLWNYNPVSKQFAPSNVPWHKLPDFGSFGDIKIFWEASRFPHLYHLICAYSETQDEKYGIAARDTIIDWIDKNPYPYGVNYKCGQEISFRIFSWILALDYFRPFFDYNDIEKIQQNIQVSLRRIWFNYSYASKWVRNNHSVSEAAGLLIGGLIFPHLKESKKYVKKATKFLIKELNYQVFKDGAYIQHSFNYQRLVIDVLSFVIFVSKKTNYILPKVIYEKHQKLTNFLASFVMPDGTVPNYGANDGAMLFTISDYRDFRTSLNFASMVNNETKLFDSNFELCDFFGLEFHPAKRRPIYKGSYPGSGYYILQNEKITCFIRCHNYKSRPGHSDALHLDIWVNGKNIFCDTGSYSYNTSKENKLHFSGIFGHNTIVIDNEDYMKSVFNFGKTNWPKGKVFDYGNNKFSGEHYGYRKGKGIIHRRNIKLEDSSLIVVDNIYGIKKSTIVSQNWHTEYPVNEINTNEFEVANVLIKSNLHGEIRTSKVSRYYNRYSEAKQIIFQEEVDKDITIETIILIK